LNVAGPIEFRGNPELERFAAEVESFCDVIENLPSYDLYNLLTELDERLPLLYSLAHRLPNLDFDNETEAMEAQRTEIAHRFRVRRVAYWESSKEQLDEKFGSRSRYALVFDPIEQGEPVECGFGEDIGSVYGDLKETLDLFREGSEAAAQQASWDWKFGLNHWGKHVLDALAAIHSLLNWHYDDRTGGFDR
jgi:hypothetical protein